MDGPDGIAEPLRERIIDAVLAELVDRGIDEFTATRVAGRADVEMELIHRHWPDDRILLMDAMLTRARNAAPVPDTGSLGRDIEHIAASLADLTATQLGRQWFRRVLPGGRDIDLSEIGSDFWASRMRAVEQIFRRAAQRDELRPGVQPDMVTQMLAAALSYDMVFNDRAISPDYADQVRDVFLYGTVMPDDAARFVESQERERARALLRATCDAAVDPIALIEAVRDLDGHIADFIFLEINRAAGGYLHRSREDLIGGSLSAMLSDLESSGILARLREGVETGEPVIVEDFPYLSPVHGQLRWYDVRGGRADADRLSITWRDVTYRSRRRERTS